MDPKQRAIITFGLTVRGIALPQQSANRQAAKLGVPQILVGLIAAGIAHEF